MLYHQGAFFYFGGEGLLEQDVIAKFDETTRQWSHIGYLLSGRNNHGAIFEGNHFLVIGGDPYEDWHDDNSLKTEKCTLTGSGMICEEQQPELEGYSEYPELFLVPGDYCNYT